jgi:hypothetical protein
LGWQHDLTSEFASASNQEVTVSGPQGLPEGTIANLPLPGSTCTLHDDCLGTACLRVTGELDIATAAAQ